MPSGLTCDIYNGTDTSLRGFILMCATQFGPGYRASKGGERKLPADKAPVLKVEEYYNRRANEALEDLDKWNSLFSNLEEAQKLYDIEYEQRKRINEELNKEREEAKERYLSVYQKVKEWEVPETYKPIKKFMIEQLEKSINWDCSHITTYKEEKVPIEQWLNSKIKSANSDLQYYREKYNAEVQEVNSDNEYLKGLYEILPLF